MRFSILFFSTLLLGGLFPFQNIAQTIDWSSAYYKPIPEKGQAILFTNGAIFFQNDGKEWSAVGNFAFDGKEESLVFPGDINDLVKKKEIFDSGFYRPDNGMFVFSKKVNAAGKKYQLYQSSWVDGKWKKPELLFFVNEGNNYQSPVWSKDLSQLYYSCDEENGFGGMDIYTVRLHKGIWNIPRNVGSPVNTFSNEMYAYPSSKGSLIFSSDRAVESKGKLKIFFSSTNAQYQTYDSPILLPHSIQDLDARGLFLFDEIQQIGFIQQADLGYRLSICKNKLNATFQGIYELPKDLEVLLISENGITTEIPYTQEGFEIGLPASEKLIIQAKANGFQTFQKEINTLPLNNPNEYAISILLAEEEVLEAPKIPETQETKPTPVEEQTIVQKDEGPIIKEAPASQADESGIIMIGGGVFKHPTEDKKERKKQDNPVEKRPKASPELKEETIVVESRQVEKIIKKKEAIDSITIEVKKEIKVETPMAETQQEEIIPEDDDGSKIKDAKAKDADDSGIIMVGGGVFKHPTEEKESEKKEEVPVVKKEAGIKDVKGDNIEMEVEEDGLIRLKGADD